MVQKAVLVTGGAGYIGTIYIIEQLIFYCAYTYFHYI